MSTRKICVVTATRAEYGLLYWLLDILRNDARIELQIVVTGAHLSQQHGMTVSVIERDGFEVAAKIPMLLQDDTAQGITKSLGLATIGFADAYAELRPDIVVILGDRYEMLAAAQAALIARLPIAHLHGGEVTRGAIDEAIRHAITKMSHLHFVATEEFRRRVIQLGEIPEHVWTVGATGLDNIARLSLMDRKSVEAELNFSLGQYCFLVTYHPVTLSHESPDKAMKLLLETLEETGANLLLTGVNADTGGGLMRKEAERFAISLPHRVRLFENLGSLVYLSVMQHVDAVIGNSSSGLLEAPAIGIPSVDIGKRQQGRLLAPSVIHCEADAEAIRKALKLAMSAEHKAIAARKLTPYGTPGAAQRIADVLCSHPLDGLLFKAFYDVPVGAL